MPWLAVFSRCSSFYSTRLLSQSSAEVRDCAKTRYSKREAYSVNNRTKWLPGHRKTGTFRALCLVIFVPSKSVGEFQCSEDLIVGKLLFCVLDCNSVGLSRPQRSQLIVFSFVLRNIRIFARWFKHNHSSFVPFCRSTCRRFGSGGFGEGCIQGLN